MDVREKLLEMKNSLMRMSTKQKGKKLTQPRENDLSGK